MGELPRITRALRAHTNLEKPRNLTQSIKMQRAAKFKYKPRYKTFSEIVDHIKKNETQYDSIIKLLENLKDECHNMTGEESYEIAEEASVHMLLLFLDQQLVLVDHIATLRALYGAVTSSTANTILKIVQKITALISDDTKEYIKDETDVVIEDREVKELIDCWGGLMICGDKSYGPEADERKMREMKQKRGTDSKIVEEFSMSYKEPKPVKDVSKDNACASSSKPQFGKDWLEDNIRKHYPANTAAILQGVLNYLHSPKNNEEIQNELFDLIGFENLHLVEDLLIHRKEIVKDLLAPKPSANRMAGTGARPKIPKPEKEKKMPQFLCQVSVQTEQDKLLAKLTRKEEKKMSKNMSKNKRDKEDIEETPELTLEQLAHERLLLYVKPPYECPNYDYRDPILRRIKYHEGYIEYPHVYDSSRKAKNAAGYISMSRVILPENTIRKENKEYEEVTLPKSEPAPLEVGDTLIAVSELDEVGQMAFENIKELNRIQSVVFQTAYNTNENLLICAPTGAGKTNIALLTVVHQIKKHTEHNVILKDKFKIIYIAPMKALAAEMTASFGKRLRGLGISVRELTGDMKLTRAEVQDTQMIVTTPEKWDVVTRKGFTETELTTIVKLIIIDEVHLLNGDRGPVVEAIVARTLRQVESSQNMIRIIGLSATLPNYLDVARFLRVNPNIGLFFFDSRFRPVPLEQHFIGVKEIPKNSTVLGQLQQMNDICYDKALEMVKQGHQVMVFVHARNATHNLASIFKTLAQLKGHTKHFESEASAGFLKAQKSINSSPNKVLAELFSAGFACHHAGMLRSDRNLVEKYFSDGYIKVLVCTSTLAWGVNLPAHAVIIRGTEVYDDSKGSYVDLSILDVLQIFGRAGRPQFDTSGTAYIVTTQDKLNHYLRAMTCQMPIESNFITLLADNLNAEVALGTVATIDEAAEWLSYTFLFERMKLRPIAYGLRNQDVLYEPNLETKRRELCIAAAKRLDKATMIRYTESLGDLHTTDLGRTASHYYITVETMETFNKRVRKSMTPADVMAMLTLCSDFKQLKSRREEARELDALRDEHCHLGVVAARFSDEPNVKVNILLQSHISRAKVYSASLQTDLNYIAQNAVRVIRALFEITLRKNNSYMAAMYLNMAKMFELQMWEFHSVMRQFNCFSQEVINKIEQPLLEPHHLRDMDVHELGDLIRNPKVARQLSKCAYEFPLLEMEATMHPITMTILKIRLTITADFNWNDKYHGKSPEAFWVWVEDPEYDIMYYQEYFLLTKKQVISREPQELVIMIPLVEPLPPQYYIRATSERWLGSESVLPLTFHHLILPDMHPQNVELRHLRPIPKTALGKLSYESLYNFTHFNPIQTQIFNTVYHTDNNVLLGAPTGSGKTIVAELAMFRAFNKNPKCKVVYIAPLKALVKERVKDWKIRFENKLGLRVVELTGDVSPDMRAILNSQVIVTTPEKWDGISRSWQSRPYVRDVTLMVIDEIHLLGEDRGPVLEVIVSRANFITTHTRRKLRIVGLTTALANASDLGRWLKIGERGVYNFKPTVRPVPMQIHVLGFPGRHYCPRMLTMNKPTFQAIKTYSPKAPSLVFVSSRRQTRLTALDLIAFLASEVDPKQWLHMAESEMEQILSSVKDSNLKLTLAFGIGIHHAGLHERDRQTVEELFVNQKIQVLICTATLAWGVNFPAHLVVIKGTEYFDGKQKRYVDMPITDVMQMVGRAGRPQYDNEGVAVLLVHDSKKNFYMKFLYEPFPVESNLREVLSDHLNAEIVADTLLSKEDIVEYMSSTYLFIRLMKNPSYYNLESNEPEEVNSYLEKLIDTALAQLIDASCVEYGSDQLRLDATFVGRIASYYYLSHKTMAHFRARLTDRLGAEELLRVLADCEEYATLPVRHNEDVLNGELADHMRLPVDRLALDSSNVKAFLLLQAHILRAPLPNVDYSTDTKSVLDQTIRILQAMIDMSAEYGWLSVCLACQTLMQSIVQARWPTDSPLTILPHVESQHLKIFTEINKEIKRPVGVLNGLKKYCSYEILAKHMRKDKQFDEKQIEQIYTAIREFPTLNLKFAVRRQLNGEPKTKEIRLRRRGNPWTELIIDQEYELIVTMERQGGNTTNVYCPRFPRSKNEGWFLNLGIKDIGELVALKRVPPKGKSSLTFRTPSQPGRVIYTVYVMSDTYMGLDQQYNLQFEVIDPMPTLALEKLSISADKE